MLMDVQSCYRALRSRDARFDGRFYIAVTSTGVYCRPICPAPTAKRENCEFYQFRWQARAAGYRPCLRCFPAAAPGVKEHTAIDSAARLLARTIDDNLAIPKMITFAQQYGCTDRTIRRRFRQAYGLSPQAYLELRRIESATSLVYGTSLPLTAVANAAGFSTISQFNRQFKQCYHRTPSQVRRSRSTLAAHQLSFRVALPYRKPFSWNYIKAFLGPRCIPGVERLEHNCYQRLVTYDGRAGVIAVSDQPVTSTVEVTIPVELAGNTPAILAAVRTMFDLDADPMEIDACLSDDPWMAQIRLIEPGLRLVGAWSLLEVGIRAIVGQQITVNGARALLLRILQRIQPDIADRNAQWVPFPSALEFIAMDWQGVGMPQARANTIIAYCSAVANNLIEVSSSRAMIDSLLRIKGIGPWTANYITMRTLGDPDAFPANDTGLISAFRRMSGDATSPRAELVAAMESRAERWRPWRAYAAMNMWRSLAVTAEEQ